MVNDSAFACKKHTEKHLQNWQKHLLSVNNTSFYDTIWILITGETVIKLNLALAAMLITTGTFAQTPAPVVTTSTNPSYLAATCANCHGSNGNSVGPMPSLAGLKASYLSEQMRAFRDGKRAATIMHQLAKGYTDPQIDAIASYFAAQTTK
jgi:cytochrome subunit of sulfide dehydrogenase